MNFLQNSKIPLAILVGALIVGGFIYFSQNKSTQSENTQLASPAPTSISTPTTPPAAELEQDDTAAIKQAVSQKLGQDENSLEISISQKTEVHAKGTVREKEAVGGGYFLAAKTDTGWVVVYDGQSQPPCSQINAYNFPKTFVPECLDLSGKVITR